MSLYTDLHRSQRRSRALVRALNEEALEEAGQRIRRAQAELARETDRVAVQVTSAVESGISVAEVAELTGLTRQKVYELRDRIRGRRDEFTDRVLTQLASVGSLASAEVLARDLGAPEGEIQAALSDLQADKLLEAVHFSTAATDGFVYRPTQAGLDRIERWLLRGDRPGGRWTVFVSLDSNEVAPLREVLPDVLDPHDYALVEPAGGAADLAGPELGISLSAQDESAAADEVIRTVRQLREQAGVREDPVLITMAVPSEVPREETLQTAFAAYLRDQGFEVEFNDSGRQGYDLTGVIEDQVVIASLKSGERVGTGAVRAIAGLSAFSYPGAPTSRALVRLQSSKISADARSLAEAAGVDLYVVDDAGKVSRDDA